MLALLLYDHSLCLKGGSELWNKEDDELKIWTYFQ